MTVVDAHGRLARATLGAALARLAARLLLRAPDAAFLRECARAEFGDAVDDAERLGLGSAAAAERFAEDLAADDGALGRLAREHRLSALEVDVLLIGCLPAWDERYGDLFAAWVGSRRPTLGLAVRVLHGEDADRAPVRAHLGEGRLWTSGLLVEGPSDVAFFDRVLVPAAVVEAGLDGRWPARLDDGTRVRRADDVDAEELALIHEHRPPVRELVDELVRWDRVAGAGVVHLVTREPGEARALAGLLARALDRGCVHVGPCGASGDVALAAAAHAAWLHEELVGVDATAVESAPRWRGRRGPARTVVIATPPSIAPRLPAGVPLRRVSWPRPRPVEQAAVWEHLLARHDGAGDVDVDALANRTCLGVAQIARVVRTAAERAVLGGRAGPSVDDVHAALAEVVEAPVSALANVSRPVVRWSRLVLDGGSKTALENLVRRVRHRVTVRDRWGVGRRGAGLVALLHGESGTGKTFGAEAVATQLGLPMMAVDLSRVVSKYIGETEKHLSTLFDQAEGFGALLFFDEADALFGKRTGVKDAHDRYANIEINYLLQRLETFEGIALLATNLLQNLDPAFVRRMQFIVHLPRPTARQQVTIWRQHLPTDRLADDVDLAHLVRRFDLVGGEIHNAAVSAAYEAAARDGVVSRTLLEGSIREELLKRGRPVPAH